jgi:hypothetical protein
MLAEPVTSLLSCGCVFPFEELTDSKYFDATFKMDWQIGNYGFGASPQHPFLAAIIDNCRRAQADPAWVAPMIKGVPRPFVDEFYILNTTGPGLVSRTYAENPDLAASVTILFPEDVRDPRTWHQFGTYGVHQMIGDWRTRDGILNLRLRRLWEGWRYRRTLARSKGRGPTRRAPVSQAQDLSRP